MKNKKENSNKFNFTYHNFIWWWMPLALMFKQILIYLLFSQRRLCSFLFSNVLHSLDASAMFCDEQMIHFGYETPQFLGDYMWWNWFPHSIRKYTHQNCVFHSPRNRQRNLTRSLAFGSVCNTVKSRLNDWKRSKFMRKPKTLWNIYAIWNEFHCI